MSFSGKEVYLKLELYISQGQFSQEILDFVNKDMEITEKEDVITYAKKMQEKGAGNVLVSMAGDGAVLVAEDGSIFQAEAPKGKVVNSVGAGDSMVAGFVTGYLKTGSYKEAFQMGVCTGSASAFSEELATEPEVLALLDKNKGIFK